MCDERRCIEECSMCEKYYELEQENHELLEFVHELKLMIYDLQEKLNGRK